MVLFYTGPGKYAPGTWHLIPLEQAKGQFGNLDWNDWRSIRELWLYGPGKAKPSALVAEVTGLDPEEIKNLPPGSYITCNKKEIVSKE